MTKLKKLHAEQDSKQGKAHKQIELPEWLGPVLKKYSEIKDSIEMKDQHEIISLQGNYSTFIHDASVSGIRQKGNLHKEPPRAVRLGNSSV